MNPTPIAQIVWKTPSGEVAVELPQPTPKPKVDYEPARVFWIGSDMWVVHQPYPIKWSSIPDMKTFGVDWQSYFYELQPAPLPPSYPPSNCKCAMCVNDTVM